MEYEERATKKEEQRARQILTYLVNFGLFSQLSTYSVNYRPIQSTIDLFSQLSTYSVN